MKSILKEHNKFNHYDYIIVVILDIVSMRNIITN
jgi:hypothetical protein